MMLMIELVDKTITTIITIVFHMFKKLEKRIMLSIDMEDIK